MASKNTILEQYKDKIKVNFFLSRIIVTKVYSVKGSSENYQITKAVSTFAAQTDNTESANNRERICIMNHEIRYTWVGDYLLPDIKLIIEPGAPPLGRYGRMRRAFLREHCPIQYSALVLSEQLFPHLWEMDAIADKEKRRSRKHYRQGNCLRILNPILDWLMRAQSWVG